MALEKVISVDLIEILENGSIQVRTKTAIKEDGSEINSTFHRRVIVPGDNYSQEESKIRAICAVVHTA